MTRKFLLVAMLVAGSLSLAVSVDAAPLSPNNPYRSFNISGYNYGSMQWERDHGNRSHRSAPRQFRLFGRWR